MCVSFMVFLSRTKRGPEHPGQGQSLLQVPRGTVTPWEPCLVEVTSQRKGDRVRLTQIRAEINFIILEDKRGKEYG